ncbi:MAG TPA: hypothetical protein VFU81_09435 [Thermomicrobiales bacterium]|nr:hypothetical protein [Thermomicrobiales bacterium]
MRHQDRHDVPAGSASAAHYAATLRAALEAVVEMPPPLRALQEQAARATLGDAAGAENIVKRDALQAGASHRDRVRARLLALEAAIPEPALAAVQAAAVAAVRDELPRLAALEALVDAEAQGDPASTNQAMQAVRDARALADADRTRLGVVLRALSGAQRELYELLDLPVRVRTAFDLDTETPPAP